MISFKSVVHYLTDKHTDNEVTIEALFRIEDDGVERDMELADYNTVFYEKPSPEFDQLVKDFVQDMQYQDFPDTLERSKTWRVVNESSER